MSEFEIEELSVGEWNDRFEALSKQQQRSFLSFINGALEDMEVRAGYEGQYFFNEAFRHAIEPDSTESEV